ncbi:hypothetical protein [Xanthocytophaga flava]|uniref:hypothetical protein n=1 Tax=Xanthocytophaga flava TaxID=3048013 RepID=UPI0028D76B31|nr:hypothetical protein [Xanthocytophaga flavus]MDJ1471048.1 hypothetical protein [Xanthocytophaga flavus]
METQPTEKENIIRLLLSGQENNITLGLQLAESQKIDLTDFTEDIDTLVNSMQFVQDKSLSLVEKLVTIGQEEKHNLCDPIPWKQLHYLTNTEGLDLNSRQLISLPTEI